MKFFKAIVIAALSLAAGSALAQTDLQISGQVSWQTLNNQSQVNIKIDRISNRSPNRTSGTVIVKLRATSDPDPVGLGYTLGEIYFSNYADNSGRLEPGEYFYDIDITVPFNPPADGTYYTHIAVYEYPNESTILDYVTMNGTTTWGSPPPPRPLDDHSNTFSGATPIVLNNSYNGRLESAGDYDFFTVTVNEPGTLQLYSDGSTDTVGRLYDAFETMVAEGDDSTTGVNFNVSAAVSPGTYYIAVSGYEDIVTGDYVLSTSFTPDQSSTTPPPPPPPNPQPISQPTDSSGGGGSLGWLSLLALLSVRAFRRRN